jgi:hypothetical protein
MSVEGAVPLKRGVLPGRLELKSSRSSSGLVTGLPSLSSGTFTPNEPLSPGMGTGEPKGSSVEARSATSRSE